MNKIDERFETRAEAEIVYKFQNKVHKELEVFFEKSDDKLLDYDWHSKFENTLDSVYKHFKNFLKSGAIDEIELDVNGVHIDLRITPNSLPDHINDYAF